MWNQPARENGHLEPLWSALACTDTFGSCHISRLGADLALLTIISRSSPISACVSSKVLNTVSPITLSTPSADCPLPNQRPELNVRNGWQLGLWQKAKGVEYTIVWPKSSTWFRELSWGHLSMSAFHWRLSLTSTPCQSQTGSGDQRSSARGRETPFPPREKVVLTLRVHSQLTPIW